MVSWMESGKIRIPLKKLFSDGGMTAIDLFSKVFIEDGEFGDIIDRFLIKEIRSKLEEEVKCL